ncbi:MAG: GIY-YIG nuclease family protein [Elusimicrobia bacterium]|nr:GIY-YIG nuclease family protein [Elusimicrobiota bacterium]
MEIKLSEIYPIRNPEQYKLHLACWNGTHQPLDVFVRDRKEWEGWNRWCGTRNDFGRDFILAFIDFYPEKERWLFGGAYRVISRKPVRNDYGYRIELLAESKPFIGRLKLSLKRPGRAKAFNLEKYYNKFIVTEILAAPYTGEVFPGYDRIDVDFPRLEQVLHQRPDWRTALENAKGVYLITNRRNGKRYVGSAYGASGVLSRWECYIGTGHGYTDELTRLISRRGLKYAKRNFRFALLEYFSMKTDDDFIIQREKYWKDVLLSRERGYNRN